MLTKTCHLFSIRPKGVNVLCSGWVASMVGHLLTIRLSRKWPGLGSQGSHNVRACVVVMIELKWSDHPARHLKIKINPIYYNPLRVKFNILFLKKINHTDLFQVDNQKDTVDVQTLLSRKNKIKTQICSSKKIRKPDEFSRTKNGFFFLLDSKNE